VITIKGIMDYEEYTDMLAYYDAHQATIRPRDFDQFFIRCAYRGFKEVMKDRQVQR